MLIRIILILAIMMAFCPVGEFAHAVNSESHTSDSIYVLDTLLSSIGKLPVILRQQTVERKPKADILGPISCSNVRGLLQRKKSVTWDLHEGIIYHPKVGGGAYPLFFISGYPIKEGIDSVEICSYQEQSDWILGYGEKPIFDYISMLQYGHDSLPLKKFEFHEVVKK